jgi:hypothetical protein
MRLLLIQQSLLKGTKMMTWDELAKEIAEMSPAERRFSVSVMIWDGAEYLVDEVAFEEQGDNIGETTRPILMVFTKNEET